MNIDEKRQGLAVLALTETGSQLARELGLALEDCTVYLPVRFMDKGDLNGRIKYIEVWQDSFAEAFNNYAGLICIMAAGIVVRSAAPLLTGKYTDPAVVVVDEKGRFVISLLSGHVGGGNQLALDVAEILDAQPVITTATDVQNKPAIDIFAQSIEALIQPEANIRVVNRHLAENKEVYLYSNWPLKQNVAQGLSWELYNENTDLNQPAVIITHEKRGPLVEQALLTLKPKNLTLGIGCRKDVTFPEIKTAVNQVLNTFNIDIRCIKNIGTIDIKSEEKAIKQLAANLDVPLITVTKSEIQSISGSYQESDWVKQVLGVGGVCEPAARLVSQHGLIIVPKQIAGPVTISIVMGKSWWLDWDRVAGNI